MKPSDPMCRLLPAVSLLALLALGCLACDGNEIPSPRPDPLPRPGLDGARAFRLLEKIVATGPRTPGSQAAAKTRNLLKEELRAMGLKGRSQYFKRPIRGVSTTLVNLWTEIPGTPGKQIVLVGTHYDTKIMYGHPDPEHNFEFQGANDSGSGTVILIELARKLLEREERAFTYRLVWFDGEESVPFDWVDSQALFGSRHCAQEWERQGVLERVRTLVLVDIVGAAGLKLDDDTNSSTELKELFTRAAADLGFATPLFHGPAYPVIDDHIPFKEKGVEVINLIGLNQLHQDRNVWHTPRDRINRVSQDSLALVGDIILRALELLEQ